tara:strand:+ start:6895 stop:7590 length:696 start_codon:yes stop_codon:yes gene_type:complete
MRSPTGRIARREIRLLEAEVKMLEHYHSQCVEIFEDYKSEWYEDLAYFIEHFDGKRENPVDDKDEEKEEFVAQYHEAYSEGQGEQPEEDESQDVPEWAKKLYKKIAMIAHPDRVSDEERRKSLEKIFRRASEAIESGDFEDLIAIALDFDISSGLDDTSLKPVLKAQVGRVRSKIEKIETEIPWVWGESYGNHNLRCTILRPMLAREKILRSDDELLEAIKKREKINHESG